MFYKKKLFVQLAVVLSVLWYSHFVVAADEAAAKTAAPDKKIEQWGIYEIELKGPTDGNPFTDVDLSATFTPNGAKGEARPAIHGFYDGDGVYRIRFMPEKTGTWE